MVREKEPFGVYFYWPQQEDESNGLEKKIPSPFLGGSCAHVVCLVSALIPEGETGYFMILCPTVTGDSQRITICLLSLFYILVESL